METFMKADIFFFITTITVALLGVFFIVVLIYAIRILKNVDDLARNIKEEGTEILKDARDLREKIKTEGAKFAHVGNLFSLAREAFVKKATKSSSRVKKEKNS